MENPRVSRGFLLCRREKRDNPIAFETAENRVKQWDHRCHAICPFSLIGIEMAARLCIH